MARRVVFPRRRDRHEVGRLPPFGLADSRCAELAGLLLRWQWPDGGWNCDRDPAANTSSLFETLLPMRGLSAYGTEPAKRAARAAAEVFLTRRLAYSASTGALIRADFAKLHYPLFWHYDILGGLGGLMEVGLLDDPRCADALDLLESMRVAHGWPAHARFYQTSNSVDWGGTSTRRANEWVTADALCVLRAAGRLEPARVVWQLEVINVGQRANLYKVINRLSEAGLIAVRGTSRDQQYPERTSHELTDAGRAASRQWMAEILSTARNEFPEFPAALSFLPLLNPRATAELLDRRRESLVQRLAERDAALAAALEGYQLSRVTMLETEYLRAVTQAELHWIDGVLAGLRDGSISWSREELEIAPRGPGGRRRRPRRAGAVLQAGPPVGLVVIGLFDLNHLARHLLGATLVFSFLLIGLDVRAVPDVRRFGTALTWASPLTLALFLAYNASFDQATVAAGHGVAGLTQRILFVNIYAWIVAFGGAGVPGYRCSGLTEPAHRTALDARRPASHRARCSRRTPCTARRVRPSRCIQTPRAELA